MKNKGVDDDSGKNGMNALTIVPPWIFVFSPLISIIVVVPLLCPTYRGQHKIVEENRKALCVRVCCFLQGRSKWEWDYFHLSKIHLLG